MELSGRKNDPHYTNNERCENETEDQFLGRNEPFRKEPSPGAIDEHSDDNEENSLTVQTQSASVNVGTYLTEELHGFCGHVDTHEVCISQSVSNMKSEDGVILPDTKDGITDKTLNSLINKAESKGSFTANTTSENVCQTVSGCEFKEETTEIQIKTIHGTQKPNASSKLQRIPFIKNDIADEETNGKDCMAVKSDLGDMKLIPIYMISVNGKKSNLPNNINHDAGLRLQNSDSGVLLLTNTICYRVSMEKDELQLEDISRKFFPKPTHQPQQPDSKELDEAENNYRWRHHGMELCSRDMTRMNRSVQNYEKLVNKHSIITTVTNDLQQHKPTDEHTHLANAFEKTLIYQAAEIESTGKSPVLGPPKEVFHEESYGEVGVTPEITAFSPVLNERLVIEQDDKTNPQECPKCHKNEFEEGQVTVRNEDSTRRESPVLEQPKTMCCGRPPEEVGTKPKVAEAVRFPQIIEGRIVEENELSQPSQDYALRQHDGDIQSMRNNKAQSIPRAQQTRDFRITVIRGKLNETKADILVNTASANLDLRKGAVSHCLLQTAGNQLQTEISSSYKNGIRPSGVAVTAGYKLQCKHVFHGALKLYDQNKHDQVVHEFRQFIRNCLVAAQTKGAKSIAFPAIGTGNLRYPLALVVDEMYNTVNKYKEETPNTTLVDVRFVVFDGDFRACEAFEKRQQIENAKYNDSGRKAVQGSPVEQERQGHLKIKVTGHKTNTEKAMTMVGKLLYPSKHNKETDMKSMPYAGALQLQKQQTRTSTLTVEARKPSKQVIAFRCDTLEGIAVLVYEGNILHLPVDCIVNPANNQLGHAAGLALAIAKAAGYWLIQDSNELIKKHGRVPTGDAVKTTAGNLKYKCVIHAVGPCWSDFSPHTVEDIMKCRDDLESAIFTSLLIAESNSMTSIAIPAVSSAIFGVPKEICVMEYVKAVQKFSSSRPKHLKEVHFVDIDPPIIGLLKQGFTDVIIDRKPCPWNWTIYAMKESSADASGGANAHAHQKDPYQAIPNFIESRQSLTCKFTWTRIVSVSREDIFSFKGVDVIVCSENMYGTATGGVAKLLLKKGGSQYEHEKKHQFKITKPKTGDVIITRGGNTGYKWIIHAVMPHRSQYGQDERGWEKALRTMIDTIFDTVENRGYRSMVMSPLGTGAGNSDPMQCAKVLLDSLTVSCTRYPDSDLFLHVVNINAERNQIVSKLFKEHVLASKTYLQSGFAQDTKRATSKNERTPSAREGKRPTENTKCAICLDNMVNPKTLKCGHAYCSSCIDKSFKVKPVCPTCGPVCGKLTGDQPDGDMTIEKFSLHLPGHADCDTIRITYDFGSGTQGGNHPTPGRRYQAVTRIAYLPYNDEGREVCALLKLAFERRLVFTIGVSRTTGEQGVITWNDIHHKTDTKSGAQFGYPDSTYFTRVKEELVVKGVTITDPDLEKNLKKKLDTIGKETIPVKTCRSSGSFETTI